MLIDSVSHWRSLRLALFAGALLLPANCAFGAAFKSGSIVVEDAWSRATPAGAEVAAGYFTVKNEGKDPDRLVSASSKIAARAEMHEMKMTNDVMTMRPVPDGVVIPPGGSVSFAPSGYHLMFMQLAAPLKEGEQFSGTLTFEHAGAIEVTFDVKGMGANAPGGHDHH
jgi:copper(I)-binding protein